MSSVLVCRWLMIVVSMLMAFGSAASAQDTMRLGVLTDMTGIFSSWSGPGSLLAAQMAVEDYARDHPEFKIRVEVVGADHQNKPDIASGIARRWLGDGYDAIIDVPNSAAALAVSALLRGSRAVLLSSGAGLDSIVGKECSPNTINWTAQTWVQSHVTATASIRRDGATWFFITSDYLGGHGLEDAATGFINEAGGKVLGHATPALATSDFSSFIVEAQASRAKAIGMAVIGGDLVTLIKQAGEFGVTQGGQILVAFAAFINDIHGIGLQSAQGLTFATPFYWDLDDGKRAFSDRFSARNHGDYPSRVQAGVYAEVLHYLKAVAASGTRNGLDVVARMKQMPTDDPLFGRGYIRADGRHVHDFYIVRVKAPQDSRKPWDYLDVVATVPADEAYPPVSSSECPLSR